MQATLQLILQKLDKIQETLDTNTVGVPKKKTAKTKVKHKQEHTEIAESIYQIINKTVSTKRPNMDLWANEIRKIEEIDRIPLNKVLEVFRAANRDDFWSMNVRSPQKLRKHWDRLYMMSLQTSGLNHKPDNRESLDYYKEKKW